MVIVPQTAIDNDTRTDEELVTLSLDDTAHFAVLVSRYEAKLARYVRRKARVTQHDVEDLLQDIFMKVYMNLRGFDTSLSFSSWIYRIAHNHIISWYRKQSVRPHDRVLETEDTTVFQLIASETNIHFEYENKELQQAVAQCITELGEKYRDIIELRFFEYKDYEEIADILQIPPGTVATRLNRGKKKLVELMQPYI